MALRDRIEHARCATIEYGTQAFQLLSLIALTQMSISTVGQFLSQPNPNRVAKFLT